MQFPTNLLLLIAVLCVKFEVRVDGYFYNNEVSKKLSITSNDVMTAYLKVEGRVKHMEPDLFIPNNILFADGNSLKTTDGENTTIVSGSAKDDGYQEGHGAAARFYDISDFTQISERHVIVVDSGNDCLRLIDRESGMSSQYLGYCGVGGGPINYPLGIISDVNLPGMVLVSDDFVIHHINTSSQPPKVSEAFDVNSFYMTQDPDTGDIFTTSDVAVKKISYSTKSEIKIAGSNYGYKDGNFSLAKFKILQGILLVERDTLLVADEENNRIRVLNFNTNQTSSICSGGKGHQSGNSTVCTLTEPNSLMVMNGELYVGEWRRIRKLQGYENKTNSATKPAEGASTLPTNMASNPEEWYDNKAVGFVAVAVTAGLLLLIGCSIVGVFINERRKAQRLAMRQRYILNRPLPEPQAVAADTDRTGVYDLPGDEYYEDMAEENAEYISASGVYFLPNSHDASNDPTSVNEAAGGCTKMYENENNNMLGEQADPGQFGCYVLDAKIASADK